MTAKEFLRQYEHANSIAERCRLEYEKELAEIDAISINMDGMPRGSGISNPTEAKALRLADKALKWEKARLDALEKRQEVFEAIYDIPAPEGDILIERYINLRHWEEICILVHYSWTQTHEHHKKALRIVRDRIEANA